MAVDAINGHVDTSIAGAIDDGLPYTQDEDLQSRRLRLTSFATLPSRSRRVSSPRATSGDTSGSFRARTSMRERIYETYHVSAHLQQRAMQVAAMPRELLEDLCLDLFSELDKVSGPPGSPKSVLMGINSLEAGNFGSGSLNNFKGVMESSEVVRTLDTEGNKIINDYTVLAEIGRGTSGKVKLCIHNPTEELRAMKIIPKSVSHAFSGSVEDGRFAALHREVQIMKQLRHQNLLSLYEVIDDPSARKMYLIMEYSQHGALRQMRPDNTCDRVPSPKVLLYLNNMVAGLRYLHRHNIFHRDIKPDNILLIGDRAVLADFGVSEIVAQGQPLKKTHGTPAFFAPELVLGDTAGGEGVDVWALGVTVFALLYGTVPFAGDTMHKLFDAIVHNEVVYPDVPGVPNDVWTPLLAKIFVKDPAKRIGLEDIKAFGRKYGRALCHLSTSALSMTTSSLGLSTTIDSPGESPSTVQLASPSADESKHSDAHEQSTAKPAALGEEVTSSDGITMGVNINPNYRVRLGAEGREAVKGFVSKIRKQCEQTRGGVSSSFWGPRLQSAHSMVSPLSVGSPPGVPRVLSASGTCTPLVPTPPPRKTCGIAEIDELPRKDSITSTDGDSASSPVRPHTKVVFRRDLNDGPRHRTSVTSSECASGTASPPLLSD